MTVALSDRLLMVYNAIDKERSLKGRVIDVGSDHGFLALRCLEDKITPYVICTDIHKQPAERTRKCLEDNGFSDISEVFCTDGLTGIDLKRYDNVVMAGLGGNTIMSVLTEVLKRTPHDILKEVDLILQPQKTSDELRVFLAKEGFEIVFEDTDTDRDLFYVLIKARFTGISHELTLEEKYYGPCLLLRNDDKAVRYKEHLDEIFKIRSRGNPELRKLLEERHVL
ncbi:MAG: class I SAM-dependent methyltransferase [Clostridiales bacterium]|nr:class I SAM-dependent methyltransferase [Clostridiales bacterium]